GLAHDLASQDAAQAIINVANLLAWMKLPKLTELTDGRHSRRSSRVRDWTMKSQGGVEHGHNGCLLTDLMKLLRHFEGHKSAKTISADVVRSFTLHLPHLFNVVGRHALNAGVLDGSPIHTFRFETVERLIGTEMAGQSMQEQGAARAAMNAKERRFGSVGLNGDQGTEIGCRAFRADEPRKFFDRWRLEQQRNRQVFCKSFRDLKEQLRRLQRVHSQFKKVRLDPDRLDSEHSFPQGHQFSFHSIPRRDKDVAQLQISRFRRG